MDLKKVSPDQAETTIQSGVKKVQAPVTAKSTEVKNEKSVKDQPAEAPKQYRNVDSSRIDPDMQSAINKINSEIRDIEKQKSAYENDLNKLRAKIAGAPAGEKNADEVELNSLEASVQEADTERQQKVNELKYQMAEGKYQVSGSDIVNSWFNTD
jgi:anti-sigma28 factor (negative regulator of flagellin synthesis)